MSLFKKNKTNAYLDIIFISLINLTILYFFYTDLTIGFGLDTVSSDNLEPKPPAKMTAFLIFIKLFHFFY